MKRALLTLVLLIILSPIFANTTISSGIETSMFYHPSFDLSGTDALLMRSAHGTRITIIPFDLKMNNMDFSLNTSFIIVSPSITYNNIRNRGYIGIDLGLGFNYHFNDNLSTKINLAVGALELGEADQEEAYFLSSFITNFKIYQKDSASFSLLLPFNIIYRKQLLATTIGIGIKVNMDWI
ncbi:MAG: hypothetical protein JJE21_03145 [Spirochaetaceae bacterium]|nr:hypothetical protein [Spirochaetaceae bacterium]